jgi:uncharacterized membrane protein YraQ (UPF0718 family)
MNSFVLLSTFRNFAPKEKAPGTMQRSEKIINSILAVLAVALLTICVLSIVGAMDNNNTQRMEATE